jgi:hypothetical protein
VLGSGRASANGRAVMRHCLNVDTVHGHAGITTLAVTNLRSLHQVHSVMVIAIWYVEMQILLSVICTRVEADQWAR